MNAPPSGERLQKVLAAAGVGSRRDCEELIREGRVEVDRRVVTELGFRVHSESQEIRVDGETVHIARRIYYLVNKPQGVVSTTEDPAGRSRVIDLVPQHDHLFTVGRLDRSSEGLILVTNDGELANRLAHPRYGVSKTYRVEVAGHPTLDELDQLRKGIHLAEGRVQASDVHLKRRLKQSTLVEIVLREGRNREIRRMLARLGHKVLRLKRIAFGPLKLGEIASGGYRKLERGEIDALRHASSSQGASSSHRRSKTSRTSQAPKRKRRPTAGANRSLGKVLKPEADNFVEYRESSEDQEIRGSTPRYSTRRLATPQGDSSSRPQRPFKKQPKKKRPR